MVASWNTSTETIAEISTPPGRGGISIVRLSGPDARAIAEPMLRLRSPLAAGRACFAELVEADTGLVLDQAVVTFFAAPYSYTSDNLVEIAAHGSPVLMDHLLQRCISAGARLAEPGEFTQRAFLSGKLDLTQAEAVHGLIDATTLQQARTAAQQLGGGLSRQLQPVKQRLMELIAALEAGVDFAEDDLDLMPNAVVAARMLEIEDPLRLLEESFAYGRTLREGFRLAIVGRPNAGKSSLFNRLIRRDRAIVTAQPGTTRDPIAERLEIAGVPVELVDTAGLRATTDEAESYGVAKTREAMAEADVVVLVMAANEPMHEEDMAAIEGSRGRKLIAVVNKIDLADASTRAGSLGRHVATSATKDVGIEELRGAILSELRAVPASADTVPLTNLRQHGAVTAALQALRSAQVGLETAVPDEMLLLDLHECLSALDSLTGTTHTEEILNLIFSTFCIGK